MSDERLLELWRGVPLSADWNMNELIVKFGRLVEQHALLEQAVTCPDARRDSVKENL